MSFALYQPVTGNATFSGVVNVAPQVPNLNVASLTADTALINSGDVRELSFGVNPVRTLILGTLTVVAGPSGSTQLVEILNKLTGDPVVLLPGSQIFNCRYISSDTNFNDGTGATAPLPIQIGLGDPTLSPATAITNTLIGGGESITANAVTGGYVQGLLAVSDPQYWEGSGTSSGSTLLIEVPVAPGNHLLAQLNSDADGTLDITLEIALPRRDLP